MWKLEIKKSEGRKFKGGAVLQRHLYVEIRDQKIREQKI
jgi:hypothetical protein